MKTIFIQKEQVEPVIVTLIAMPDFLGEESINNEKPDNFDEIFESLIVGSMNDSDN